MVKKLLLFVFSAVMAHGASSYSIVFVHLGKALPEYLYDALYQARLFNEHEKIYLLANQAALTGDQRLARSQITAVPVETIKKTKHHRQFLKHSTLDKSFRDGFWFFASERFLYIDDFMQQQNLSDVFHLESDNMLYVDLKELLPVFHAHYRGLAVTFDNDDRCIPGFMYIANKQVMEALGRFFVQHASSGQNDMYMIGMFKKTYGLSHIDQLPIIMPSYTQKIGLRSPHNHTTQQPAAYSKHSEQFQSIFDGAAIGQYLGGIDQRNAPIGPGFVNESCLFNPSYLHYEWVIDQEGRKVPYAVYGGRSYRINNLHIHSKQLHKFLSR